MSIWLDVSLKRITSTGVFKKKIPEGQTLHYKIIDAKGLIVFSKSVTHINSGNSVKEELDISHLEPGIYSMLITTDNGEIIQEETTVKI